MGTKKCSDKEADWASMPQSLIDKLKKAMDGVVLIATRLRKEDVAPIPHLPHKPTER